MFRIVVHMCENISLAVLLHTLILHPCSHLLTSQTHCMMLRIKCSHTFDIFRDRLRKLLLSYLILELVGIGKSCSRIPEIQQSHIEDKIIIQMNIHPQINFVAEELYICVHHR